MSQTLLVILLIITTIFAGYQSWRIVHIQRFTRELQQRERASSEDYHESLPSHVKEVSAAVSDAAGDVQSTLKTLTQRADVLSDLVKYMQGTSRLRQRTRREHGDET